MKPSLSARMLKHHTGKKWIGFRKVDQALDWVRSKYGGLLHRLLRHRLVMALVFIASMTGVGFCELAALSRKTSGLP